MSEQRTPRTELRKRFDAILDDRWPLAGKLMKAVDEYVAALPIEAGPTPTGEPALDVERLARALEAFSIRVGDGAKVLLWRGQESQDADLIAAEYARLSLRGSQKPPEEPRKMKRIPLSEEAREQGRARLREDHPVDRIGWPGHGESGE